MPSKIKRFHVEKGAVEYQDLVTNTIQIAIPVHLLANDTEVAIDSVGAKIGCGHIEITSEMVKHLKEAYFESFALAPSATDAVVEVQLIDYTTGTKIVANTYPGVEGYIKSSDIASTLKDLIGNVIYSRVEVTTASATAGATQKIRSAVLRLVLGIS
jgi:hypothetical protein